MTIARLRPKMLRTLVQSHSHLIRSRLMSSRRCRHILTIILGRCSILNMPLHARTRCVRLTISSRMPCHDLGIIRMPCCAITDISITLFCPLTSTSDFFPRKRCAMRPNRRLKTVTPLLMRLRGSSDKSWDGANLCVGFIS